MSKKKREIKVQIEKGNKSPNKIWKGRSYLITAVFYRSSREDYSFKIALTSPHGLSVVLILLMFIFDRFVSSKN